MKLFAVTLGPSCRHTSLHPLAALALLLTPFASLGVGCADDPGLDPMLVTIQTGEPPALIAFREEARADWQTLPTGGVSTFEIAVTGPYRVVVVCEAVYEQPHVGIDQYARTPADGPSIEHKCGKAAYPFAASGQVVLPGELSLGNFSRSGSGSNWSFRVPASPGSFDLVMLSGSPLTGFDRIAIRRDVAITGDTQLGSIDLGQEGSEALVPMQLTATNLRQDETMSSKTFLYSGGTSTTLQHSLRERQPGWNARLAPESVLRATDRQTVLLTATGPGGYRIVRRDVRIGDPTSVTLPEPLGPVSFEMTTDRLVATWSALPEHDALELARISSAPDRSRSLSHVITFSRAFVDATGVTSATLDLSDLPLLKSQWRHDPGVMQFRAFVARRGASSNDGVDSGVAAWISPPISP